MADPIRVAPSRRYGNKLLEGAKLGPELLDLVNGPGKKLNVLSGKRFSETRARLEGKPVPYQGVVVENDKVVRVDTLRNPDSPDGRWDPRQYMPHFLLDPKEDAFPVDPAFDGDADWDNNAPQKANGPARNYLDGVIGGKQPLSTGFAVTKKGEYTVLTYSLYYPHNKAGSYHAKDYSTAQVYLKPGKSGKLEPAYLYSSFHHGGVLSKYSELKKDSQGRPLLRIFLGTHALLPVGRNERPPRPWVELLGDGSVKVNGKRVPQKMGFDAFQPNVAGARVLDPADPKAQLRVQAMTWGEVPFNPLLPSVFKNADVYDDLLFKAKELAGGLIARGDKLLDRAADRAGDVLADGKKLASKGGNVLKGFAKDLFG